MAPKIGTVEDYSCWDDGMARRKVGEEEERKPDQTRKQVLNLKEWLRYRTFSGSNIFDIFFHYF